MQAIVELIAFSTFFAAIMVIVAGSLNALFGWELGLRIGGTSIPLPEDFSMIIAISVALAILGGLLFIVADLKRTFIFLKANRWPVLGGVVITVAAITISLANFAPYLSLELAVQGGNTAKAEQLLAEKEYPTEVLNDLLYWSLQNEDFKLTDTMVSKGADLNYRRGEFDITLLHSAVLYFPASAADFLVEQGVEINVKDDLNRTALHHLLYYRENNLETADEAEILAITKTLVEAGADLTIQTDFDDIPIDIAKDKDYDSVVEFLESQQ